MLLQHCQVDLPHGGGVRPAELAQHARVHHAQPTQLLLLPHPAPHHHCELLSGEEEGGVGGQEAVIASELQVGLLQRQVQRAVDGGEDALL